MDIIEENEEDDNYELLERYFHEMKPKRVEFSQARVWIEIAKDSTSELERILSDVKALKSKKRSRMKAKKLEDLLMIYYYFPDAENYNKEELYTLLQQEKAKL